MAQKKMSMPIRDRGCSVAFAARNMTVGRELDFSQRLDGLYGYAIVLSRNRAEAEDLHARSSAWTDTTKAPPVSS